MAAVGFAFSIGARAQPSNDSFDVIAYFHADDFREIDKYSVEKLTHVIYSFLHLEGNRLSVPLGDGRAIEHLVSLKRKYPNLTIQAALGGWGGCETCSDVFANESGRQEFVDSVVAIHEEYGIDGLDLDWEYPSIPGYPGHAYKPGDKENFTALVRELRQSLPRRFEISFAAGAYQEYLQNSIEWKEVMPLVDRVNLMTYDLVNGFSTITGHQTPLCETSRQTDSVEHAVKYLRSLGIESRKIVIGAAFYARVWEGVSDKTGNPLYKPGVFKETVNFRDFRTRFGDDFEYFWDAEAQAPYRYSQSRDEFATFDDTRSVILKVAYATEHNLGGIMFWQLANDRYHAGLLDAINYAVGAAVLGKLTDNQENIAARPKQVQRIISHSFQPFVLR